MTSARSAIFPEEQRENAQLLSENYYGNVPSTNTSNFSYSIVSSSMATAPNRRAVFSVLRNRAVKSGNAETLVHLAPSMAYAKPLPRQGATQSSTNAWKTNMSTAKGWVSGLREDALEILRTSDDVNDLKAALRAAWPNPRGTGATALDRDLFFMHWKKFLYLFRPRGVLLHDHDMWGMVGPDLNRADAYGSFLSEFLQRQRRSTVDYGAILHMTFRHLVVEFVRAPRFLRGVFQLLCAMAAKRPKIAIDLICNRDLLSISEPGANHANRHAAAWTRFMRLVRCIARTKADKLRTLHMYIGKVRHPVAREINDLVRHAKSLPTVEVQAQFLWDVVQRQRPEPSAAVVRAVLGTLTRERLARLLAQYARLNTRNRTQTRANSGGRLSGSITSHLTDRLAAWGVLRNSQTVR